MSEIKNYVSAAKDFTSVEVKSPVLEKGKHRLRLVNAAVIHSAMTNKGEPKETLKEYEDVTTQLYCELGSVEGAGAIAHRFQLEGFRSYDKLSPDEKESGKYEPSEEGYALVTKNSKKFRVPSEENTESAQRILSQAFKAMGLPPGSKINDLQTVIDDKTEFYGVVREREYNGKTFNELHYLQEIKEAAPVGEEFE